jgi:two-component system LytT family response regulator
MIKCVVVDDEIGGRIVIKKYLEKIESISLVGEAESVISGIAEIQSKKPDLVFLDVQIIGGQGFDILKAFNDRKFEVIFVTAFDTFAIKAIKESASDYLIKPIDEQELRKAIDKVSKLFGAKDFGKSLEKIGQSIEKISEGNLKVPITTVSGMDFISKSDIIRCSSESNYTRIYLKDGTTILSAKTLKEYHKLLNKAPFFRVHKSHIVNINYVSKYLRTGFLLLEDRAQVEIAHKIKEDFLKRILGKEEN